MKRNINDSGLLGDFWNWAILVFSRKRYCSAIDGRSGVYTEKVHLMEMKMVAKVLWPPIVPILIRLQNTIKNRKTPIL